MALQTQTKRHSFLSLPADGYPSDIVLAIKQADLNRLRRGCVHQICDDYRQFASGSLNC